MAALLLKRTLGIAMTVEPFSDPAVALVGRQRDDARLGRLAQDGLMMNTWLDLEASAHVHFLETAITNDQPVVRIVEGKPF